MESFQDHCQCRSQFHHGQRCSDAHSRPGAEWKVLVRRWRNVGPSLRPKNVRVVKYVLAVMRDVLAEDHGGAFGKIQRPQSSGFGGDSLRIRRCGKHSHAFANHAVEVSQRFKLGEGWFVARCLLRQFVGQFSHDFRMLCQQEQRPAKGMSGRQVRCAECQRGMTNEFLVAKLLFGLLRFEHQAEYIGTVFGRWASAVL